MILGWFCRANQKSWWFFIKIGCKQVSKTFLVNSYTNFNDFSFCKIKFFQISKFSHITNSNYNKYFSVWTNTKYWTESNTQILFARTNWSNQIPNNSDLIIWIIWITRNRGQIWPKGQAVWFYWPFCPLLLLVLPYSGGGRWQQKGKCNLSFRWLD